MTETAPKPTPGAVLDAESVGLLMPGDLLRCVKGSAESPAIATGEVVSFTRPSGTGGISNCIVTSADDSFGYRPGRFTFLGRPDAEGWIEGEPPSGVIVEIETPAYPDSHVNNAKARYRLARPTPSVDWSHGSVYDRLLTFLHDRDCALRGDDRTDPGEIDEAVVAIMKIATPPAQPEPCFECGSTDRIGGASRPCNPELDQPEPGAGELVVVGYTNDDNWDHLMRRGRVAVTVWPTDHGKSTPHRLADHTQAQAKIARLEGEVAERDARHVEAVHRASAAEQAARAAVARALSAEADAAKVREAVAPLLEQIECSADVLEKHGPEIKADGRGYVAASLIEYCAEEAKRIRKALAHTERGA